ncbi:hypothetical protein ACJMK2_033416 [Sinanodonta woodiana]|uniref:Endonuclease/exonuclease/phosphatase domain-containing protein n=1 Tax=Sinanodonta woodiana TaxID=1069815 RepID=A0ABD3WSG3_SINWO
MVSININRIRGKRLELQAYLSTENPDIVAIQETKIDDTITSNELVPDTLEYDIYCNDRTCHGGGTMLFVKQHLESSPVTSLNNGSKSIWCKFSIHGKSHYVSSWYRPPDTPSDNIILLKDQLDKIKSQGKSNQQLNIHIMRDFNYRKVDWKTKHNKEYGSCLSDSDGQQLIDILHEAGAEQLITFPTREHNTLDLFIITLPGQIVNIQSPDRLSDHDVIKTNFKCTLPRKKVPKRTYFQYSRGNYNQMRSDARKFTKEKYLNGHHNTRSVEDNWGMIKNFIGETLNFNVPTKT